MCVLLCCCSRESEDKATTNIYDLTDRSSWVTLELASLGRLPQAVLGPAACLSQAAVGLLSSQGKMPTLAEAYGLYLPE